MSDFPIQFEWDGEAMRPASRYWSSEADKQYVVGERYRLTEEHERSMQSHRHEFAFIRSAWESLPDHLYSQFPNPEMLRKHGLIRKGFCTMKQYPCKSTAEAERLQASLRDNVDSYAIVMREAAVVSVLTAESQSYRTMGKARFQESKEALIEFIADLIGVEPSTLASQQEAA